MEFARRRFVVVVISGIACAAFLALGTWQLERRAWKHDLISRVNERAHAAPVELPPPARWAAVGASGLEYLHVRVSGIYLPARSTRVHAATALGAGYWVLSPLQTPEGYVVLVNRGFVPAEARSEADAGLPRDRVSLTGLVRMSENGGGFLSGNDPAMDRWYSRDVEAIAKARSLSNVAPFFIDADAGQEAAAGTAESPAGGMTVISFPDNHLAYALTWYGLAAMSVWAIFRVIRSPLTIGGEGEC